MTASDALVIRVADNSDMPVIHELAHAIWPGTYGGIISEAQIKHMLDLFYDTAALEKQLADGHTFLMAELNSEPVGFASYSHGKRSGVLKVHKLYVHPLVQGKGVGKGLLDKISSDALLQHARTLELNVNRYNPAKLFYEKAGFTVTGEEDIAIGEGYFMNDFIMEKTL